MDILSDLFRESGLRRRLLDVHGVPEDRALRFPCDRSVGCHVVLAGTLYVHGPSLDAPLVLGAGDIALMGRGHEHLLATRAKIGRLPVATMPVAEAMPATPADGVTVVSGAYQLWHAPLHPLFAELPPWFVLRAARTSSFSPMGMTVALLAEEARRPGDESTGFGREAIVHGLLDVLFTQLLRAVVAERGPAGSGWCHGVTDAPMRRAVSLLHADPARAWTLDVLARAVGVSRSVLAERFRTAMGDTPLAYLRTVRLQRAMRLLAETSQTLEQVAGAVGYGDAFGFSKAFKRAVGMSPGEFRRQDAAARAVPWRFRAEDAVG